MTLSLRASSELAVLTKERLVASTFSLLSVADTIVGTLWKEIPLLYHTVFKMAIITLIACGTCTVVKALVTFTLKQGTRNN